MEESVIEFFNDFDFDNMAYFYHITGSGIGEEICENGLLMENKDLISTTIRIKKDMLIDIDNFIINEHGNNIRETNEMVIIGCPIEDINHIVEKNEYISVKWSNEFPPKYIIPSEYIMGYIDMTEDEYYITKNPNYFENYYSK